jgi:hypothetical protein
LSKLKYCKLIKLPISAGNEFNLFLTKYNFCKLTKLPNSAGNDFNLLLP